VEGSRSCLASVVLPAKERCFELRGRPADVELVDSAPGCHSVAGMRVSLALQCYCEGSEEVRVGFRSYRDHFEGSVDSGAD
jgi:hypothetical protein